MVDTLTRKGGSGCFPDEAETDAEADAEASASASASAEADASADSFRGSFSPSRVVSNSSPSVTKTSSSHHPVSLSVRALCQLTSTLLLALLTALRTAVATARTARSLPMEYDPTRNNVLGSRFNSFFAIVPIVAKTSLWSGKRQRGSQYVVSKYNSPTGPFFFINSCRCLSSLTHRAARKSPVCNAVT